VVHYLKASYRVSERRACSVIRFSRATHRRRSNAPLQAFLRRRIRDLAQTRVSYGYRRIHVLLRREGWKINHKRVYRLYRMEGLAMRTKKPKRRHVSSVNRVEVSDTAAPNQVWSMDFMHDELFNGDWIRLLTLVDNPSAGSGHALPVLAPGSRWTGASPGARRWRSWRRSP
jgi:putative transposase